MLLSNNIRNQCGEPLWNVRIRTSFKNGKRIREEGKKRLERKKKMANKEKGEDNGGVG